MLNVESKMEPFIAEVASNPGATYAVYTTRWLPMWSAPTSLLSPTPIDNR